MQLQLTVATATLQLQQSALRTKKRYKKLSCIFFGNFDRIILKVPHP